MKINVSISWNDRTTTCVINDLYTGVSIQHPLDRYSKRIGTRLAVKRALDKTSFSKTERRLIWRGVWALKPLTWWQLFLSFFGVKSNVESYSA